MESPEIDNAAVHSLNALPKDEATEFQERVESDLELAEDLDSFRRVATGLIDGLLDIVPAASPELWDRISDEAGITSPDTRVKQARSFEVPLSILGMAAILIAVLAVGAFSLLTATESNDTRSLAAAAASSPSSLSVTLSSPNGTEGINPEVIIDDSGTGYIIADTLPALTADRTYQLWLIVEDRVVSAAVLGNDPGAIQFRAEGTVVGIAISNEIAGGVAVSAVEPTAIWLSDSI